MENNTPFLDHYNTVITSSEPFVYMTRSIGLQKETLSALESLYKKTTEEKTKAQERMEEEYANILLGCECVIVGLASTITMWLLLKNDEPEKAWDKLIEAQNSVRNAMRSSDMFQNLGSLYQYLRAVEKTVFPPQVFMSSGMIAKKQTCTICNQDYEDCEHIANMPYMGKFCHIRMEEFEPDHVSIVENPADKRCRVVSFDDGDISRNKMTWEERPREGDGNTMNAIILRAD